MVKLDVNKILAFVLGIVVLFITVYYASRAWRKGQAGERLIGDRL